MVLTDHTPEGSDGRAAHAGPGALPCASDGAVLPLVLFFAVAGLIAVVTFLSFSLSNAKPSLRSPMSLQALLNARSGVHKTIRLLQSDSSSGADTLSTSNPIDSMFGMGLFDDDTAQFPVSEKPEFGGPPIELAIFGTDSFGFCEVAVAIEGSRCVITSTGTFRESRRTVEAHLAGRVPALPDTVLILDNENPVEPTPKGTVVQRTPSLAVPDSGDSSASSALPGLREFIAQYQSDLMAQEDTSFFEPPLTIQSQRDLAKIPEMVKGALLIDGAFFDLSWSEQRTVQVLGDLQITGTVTIENVSFVVGGEAKILDKAELKGVSIFSLKRVFIGDEAKFSGDVLALQRIAVYGRAEVRDKSSLVVAGQSTTDTAKYSLMIAESAVMDGVGIALATPGGIKTDPGVSITGILWAQHAVCHLGKMNGLIRAERLADCSLPDQAPPAVPGAPSPPKGAGAPPPTNPLPGTLAPLAGIERYPMPFFLGQWHIASWKED